jgi:hypothetical protein
MFKFKQKLFFLNETYLFASQFVNTLWRPKLCLSLCTEQRSKASEIVVASPPCFRLQQACEHRERENYIYAAMSDGDINMLT